MTRPKIGLALGGGVARGWAHIGAIRALEANGYEPDVVCGTSIGALVGGAYLAGKLDALEEWARGLTKRRLLGYLDVLFTGTGLLGGTRFKRRLEEHLGGISIETLPKPFVAVTGELATGHEIWIQSGPLVDAIRASYALPGVFPPSKVNKRWLIDGALVNPVPISVCRAKGARLVIGITLNYDAFGKGNVTDIDGNLLEADLAPGKGPQSHLAALDPRRLLMRQLFGHGDSAPGLGSVMLASLNIVMDRLARSRMAGDPPDVLISPRIGHISLLDFDRADELIALGYEAVEAELPRLAETLAVLS